MRCIVMRSIFFSAATAALLLVDVDHQTAGGGERNPAAWWNNYRGVVGVDQQRAAPRRLTQLLHVHHRGFHLPIAVPEESTSNLLGLAGRPSGRVDQAAKRRLRNTNSRNHRQV